MRIGELATRTGVSVRALRYDEEQGLLYPTRTDGGQRRYPEAAVERVRLVPLLYAAGPPSRTVHDLAAARDDWLTSSPPLRASPPPLPADQPRARLTQPRARRRPG